MTSITWWTMRPQANHQLDGALEFLSALGSQPLDTAAFEEASGVGIEVRNPTRRACAAAVASGGAWLLLSLRVQCQLEDIHARPKSVLVGDTGAGRRGGFEGTGRQLRCAAGAALYLQLQHPGRQGGDPHMCRPSQCRRDRCRGACTLRRLKTAHHGTHRSCMQRRLHIPVAIT